MTHALRRIYQQTRDLWHAHRNDRSVPDAVIDALYAAKCEADLAWNAAVRDAADNGDEARVKRIAAVLREFLPPDRAEERARNVVMAALGVGIRGAASDCLVGHWSLAAFQIPGDVIAKVAAAYDGEVRAA